MATQYRPPQTKPLLNRPGAIVAPDGQENLVPNKKTVHFQKSATHHIIKPGAGAAARVPISRRPALGDLGANRIDPAGKPQSHVAAPAKKPPVVLAAGAKKPPVISAAAKKPILAAAATKPLVAVVKPLSHPPLKGALKKQISIDNNKTNEAAAAPPVHDEVSSIILMSDDDLAVDNDPQMVAEYVPDIMNYLRELEVKYAIRPKFLQNHASTPHMRAILVNWLVDVHAGFHLCLETLHLAVGLVDRYLQINKDVGKQTLQLVGTSALLIACKYEEMFYPEMGDFVYICDDTYSSRQIMRMEIEILSKLDFSLGRPASLNFLRRYSKVVDASADIHTLGKYILELVLIDYNLVHVKPSLLAAAATCLAISISKEHFDPCKAWTSSLVKCSGYRYTKEFRTLIVDMAQLIAKAKGSKTYSAVYEKYSHSKFCKISLDSRLNGSLIRRLTTIY